MGLPFSCMHPYRRKCNSTNFDGGHFENGVPQVVHPNLVMVASTFHVQTSPRNKINRSHTFLGGGGARGSIGPIDYIGKIGDETSVVSHKSQKLSHALQTVRNRPRLHILYFLRVTLQTIPANYMSQERYGRLEQVTFS